MYTISLEEPVVTGRTARFAWSVDPAAEIYSRTEFTLEFPEQVDLARVPASIWLRTMMICLHSQWAVLHPCRVILPRRLPPGEREFWMRLIEAEIWSLEAEHGAPQARTVELIETGPPVEPFEHVGNDDQVVACFSGGRDSLTQASLLQELGRKPLLVTTTAPRSRSDDHDTARRRYVMDEYVRRRDVELIEVRSDLRECFENRTERSARYGASVNEVTDTFLYFANALVVAVARRAAGVYLASEAEVQETVRVGGKIAQHKHFMYSAVTQLALRGLLAPTGITYGGLTYPLLQSHVQRLLGTRYADVRDLQYSCWEQSPGEDVCSHCGECFMVAMILIADDIAPSEIGIDLGKLVIAQRDWKPGGRDRRGLVRQRSGRFPDEQTLRTLRATDAAKFAEFFGDDPVPDEALRAFEQLRATAFAAPEPPPRPGYRAGYLDLIDDQLLRAGLRRILDEHFVPSSDPEDDDRLDRTRLLAGWITAPLGRDGARPAATQGAGARAATARPPSAAEPTSAQLTEVAASIPGPEPVLATSNELPVLRVAETALDGNELAYVTECIETNWISSAGAFVTRFEAAFAAACGCQHAVAVNSGAAALELMLRAAGIGPGDEVVVPAFTMVATANAVHHTGATPVLVDTDPDTWNLDLRHVAQNIGPRTRGIVAMHTYGHPVDMEALRQIAADNSLALFEDAAEAHGARCRTRPVGSLGDAAAFSFYGNKIVTTGEGGMVTTNDKQIADTARNLRDHAFSPDRHFWHRHRAFNLRMSNLQAAVGLAQVERLDELLAARRRNATLYRELLATIPGVILPPVAAGLDDANWMIGIAIGDDFGCSRDELRERLAAQGIETRTFFVPLHVQPAYIDDHEGRRHPVAEWLGRSGLYLPSAPTLTESDIARVGEAIARAGRVATADSGANPSAV